MKEGKLIFTQRVLCLLAQTTICLCCFAGFSHAQTAQTYGSPEEAMQDLVAAATAKDRTALVRIFGPDVRRMLSGDSVQEAKELEQFATRAKEKAVVSEDGDAQRAIEIGNQGWPFPIPLVKTGDRWTFDTAKGVDEMLKRRVGRNELNTILVCAAYAVAQWDYFLEDDWNNDGVQEFAQKFISTSGQKDGLYWPTTEGEDPSPIGPLVALARTEGYSRARNPMGKPLPYNGYYLKIIKGQGANAPGGRYSYLINGRMIAGFGLVAYPAVYGSSGVMTFIVNQQGRVYQKDLGVNTEKMALSLTVYNPDESWERVDYEDLLERTTSSETTRK
jgi:hypothetical protein